MPQLPRTDLTVSDLCLGGNVFGWTADQPTSWAVLDRFHDAADPLPAFVDTAESYGDGRSEEILGGWMAERGLRDRVVLATKASPVQGEERPLSAARIRAACEASLRRLQTDRIDLYYA